MFSTHYALCFSFLQRDFRIKPAHNPANRPGSQNMPECRFNRSNATSKTAARIMMAWSGDDRSYSCILEHDDWFIIQLHPTLTISDSYSAHKRLSNRPALFKAEIGPSCHTDLALWALRCFMPWHDLPSLPLPRTASPSIPPHFMETGDRCHHPRALVVSLLGQHPERESE